MNYCSLEDAWGKTNHVSNQFKEYMTDKFESPVEHFSDRDNKYDHQQVFDNNIHLDYSCDCNKLLEHVKKCKKCYNIFKNHFRSPIFEKMEGLVDENRDTIVLILIGISILLFFNLITNINKSS